MHTKIIFKIFIKTLNHIYFYILCIFLYSIYIVNTVHPCHIIHYALNKYYTALCEVTLKIMIHEYYLQISNTKINTFVLIGEVYGINFQLNYVVCMETFNSFKQQLKKVMY
jgi:hypothetical protein